jgi:hypothetical protein
MKITDLLSVNPDFKYQWPRGGPEHMILVEFIADSNVRIGLGFTMRPVFGQDRKRVIVFVNGHPEAQFVGTDDYEATGEVIGIIKKPGSQAHYKPKESLPDEYLGMPIVIYRDRIQWRGAFNSRSLLANIADFPTMIKHALIQTRWGRRAGRLPVT